jgi:hypothetical protein
LLSTGLLSASLTSASADMVLGGVLQVQRSDLEIGPRY